MKIQTVDTFLLRTVEIQGEKKEKKRKEKKSAEYSTLERLE